MARMISANKLNRFWKNGVVAKMVAKVRVLKTMEEIAANTDEENIAGASAVAELNNKLSGFEPVLNDAGEMIGYKTDIGGADTVYPFIKNLAVATDQVTVSGTRTGSVSCKNNGYAYIFVIIRHGSGGALQCNVSCAGKTLNNSSRPSGIYKFAPIAVKKGDTIAWSLAGTAGSINSICIVYP